MTFAVMGVVNATPDSFSDGAAYDPVQHARALVAEGADWVDVGGESTRPGAAPVPADEELRRVAPVVAAVAGLVPVSIDTSKAVVAEAALAAGAAMVNDVTALRGDPAMAGVVAGAGARVCLMHMRGTDPRTMQDDPRYDDVVADVCAFLAERAAAAVAAGIAEDRIWLDPGIGFGKTAEHNLELLRRLDEVVALGFPVLLGASRKSFLGRIAGVDDPAQRLPGSLAVAVLGLRSGAHAFRVHDVAATRQALAVAAATLGRHGA